MACGCSLYSSGSQLVIDQNDVWFRLVNETEISVSVPAKFLSSVSFLFLFKIEPKFVASEVAFVFSLISFPFSL
jgi:hypothetical protein